MDQLRDFADDRLINGCVYCGGPAETKDHVPSRCFLEPPFPENLPAVGSCKSCNQGFSKDEQYLVCLLEAVLVGTADPDKIKRESVVRSLRRSPALRNRIEAAKRLVGDRIEFVPENERVKNVMLKLARGHAAFDLTQPCDEEPSNFWFGPLAALSQEKREAFDAPHVQKMLGEIGSRGMQRMFAAQIVMQSQSGEESESRLLLNDWVDVQEGYYRYLAIDDVGGVVIRIVMAEYLGCEVAWRRD